MNVEFTLSESMLDYGKKAAHSNGHEHLCFEGEGDEIYMVSETVSQNAQIFLNNMKKTYNQIAQQKLYSSL